LTNKDKFKFILQQEVIYLSLSLLVALASLLNHDIYAAGRVFLYTALFFQLIILIMGWDVITKRNDKNIK
tara:strand:+ start:1802 stop:2011 length:210 start_codon:yes stop_codon:yes gene_type:complete